MLCPRPQKAAEFANPPQMCYSVRMTKTSLHELFRIWTGKWILPRIVLLAALFLGLFSCAQQPRSQSSLNWLGTTTTITIYDHPKAELFTQAFRRVEEIHERMSPQLATSEISKITRMAGISPVKVSPDTFFVVEIALEIAHSSNGAFNPAIGPLVELWDFVGDFHLPSPEEVQALLPLTDYQLVELDQENGTVYLPIPGMMLDLGAIAKGYAADEAAEVLRRGGVESAIIDFGGNIYVVGSRLDGTQWRVGVQNPLLYRGNYLGIYHGSDESVVTSGTYERFVIKDGVKYHHILDPETGFPASSGLESVTILAERSSTLADAYSTAAFVLGAEKGLEFINRIPNVEAVFVLADKSIIMTPGLKREDSPFELLDGSFRVLP